MATGSLDANGIWIYGEDDSEPTFSGLLNKLGDSVSDKFSGGKLLKANLPSGSSLQVVSGTKLDTFTSTSATYVDITGLSVSITPQSVANKVLVICQFNAGMSNTNAVFFQIVGGNAGTYIGDAASNRVRSATSFGMNASDPVAAYSRQSYTIVYLDSPATTSAITYKLQARRGGTGGTFTINRTGDDTDDNNRYRGASSITAIEVAG